MEYTNMVGLQMSLRRLEDVLDDINKVKRTVSINTMINVIAWQQYYRELPNIEGSAAIRDNIISGKQKVVYGIWYDSAAHFMLAYLILLQTEPNKSWELRRSLTPTYGAEYPYMILLQNGDNFIVNVKYHDIDKKWKLEQQHYLARITSDNSELLCKPEQFSVFRDLRDSNIRQPVDLIHTDYWKYNSDLNERLDLVERMMVPNSDIRQIMAESPIISRDYGNDQYIIVYILELKFQKAFAFVLKMHKPPGCVSQSIGIKMGSTKFDDISWV